MLKNIQGYSTPISNEEAVVYKKLYYGETNFSQRDITLLDNLYKRGVVGMENDNFVILGRPNE